MNIRIVQLVLSLFALTSLVSVAQDKPYDNTFFGHVNFALQYVDGEQDSDFDAQDHFSRFGFKGYMENDVGVQAYYHIEWQLRMTNSEGKPLRKRNMGLGVRGWFGDVFLGRNDLPSKKVQQKVDIFSDMDPDVLFAFDGDRRQADILMYSSPKINHFKGYVAFKDDDTQPTIGIDAWSAALLYQRDQLGLGYSQNKDIRKKGLISQRASVQYRYNNWQFGGLIQESDLNGDAEWGYLLSAKYQIDDDSYKLQFTESDIWKLGIASSIRFSEQLSIGWDHKITNYLTTYIRTTLSTTGNTQEDDKLYGLGIILKF